MWRNQNILYYTCKAFGLLPLSGDRKCLSFAYSAVVWAILLVHNCRLISDVYEISQTDSIRLKMWMKLVYFEICVKAVAGIVTLLVSAYRSWSFFELLDKFKKFDRFSQGQTHCLSHDRRIQIYYIAYIGFMGVCQYLYVLRNNSSYFFWPLHCSLTMLAAVYYVIFVRMTRQRYQMVNNMFENYMDNTGLITKFIYPREADRLFTKLRCLTEEVKSYYATQNFFLVIETVTILISNGTTVSFHIVYSNNPIQFHFMIIAYCLFRLIFLISVVKQTHDTAKIIKQTVFIVHKALRNSTNIVISKELDIILLNCWNQPVVFDVHGLFDMDYQLIHSILAAVGTYVVVCVQIQYAIIQHVTQTNSQKA